MSEKILGPARSPVSAPCQAGPWRGQEEETRHHQPGWREACPGTGRFPSPPSAALPPRAPQPLAPDAYDFISEPGFPCLWDEESLRVLWTMRVPSSRVGTRCSHAPRSPVLRSELGMWQAEASAGGPRGRCTLCAQ